MYVYFIVLQGIHVMANTIYLQLTWVRTCKVRLQQRHQHCIIKREHEHCITKSKKKTITKQKTINETTCPDFRRLQSSVPGQARKYYPKEQRTLSRTLPKNRDTCTCTLSPTVKPLWPIISRTYLLAYYHFLQTVFYHVCDIGMAWLKSAGGMISFVLNFAK